MNDAITQFLLAAQSKANALFEAVVREGLVRAGKLESDLTREIHELAASQFGLRRHWHKRIVRSGPNTLLGYHDGDSDRRIESDDLVYLDFGPVFDEWEADFGRTYALGADARKHKLVRDIAAAFTQGKQHFQRNPELTAGELYDYVVGLAPTYGWEFGARTAGHLIGHFPHETAPGSPSRFSVRHGNSTKIRELDAEGRPRHWILEIHFIDRQRQWGGFYEELLTA